MYQIAMVWWLLSLKGEGVGKLIGLFMVMAALPSILFVKKIGKQIDKSHSQHILVACDLMAALFIGLAGFLFKSHIFFLPLAFVFGFVTALWLVKCKHG